MKNMPDLTYKVKDLAASYLVRSASGVLIIKLTSVLLNFIVGIYLARWLGKAGFGAIANMMAWVNLLAILSLLGLEPLTVRNVASYSAKKEWDSLRAYLDFSLKTTFLVSLCMVFIAGAGAIYLFAKPSEQIMRYCLWVGLIGLPLQVVAMVRQAAIRGSCKIIQSQMSQFFLRPFVFMILILLTHMIFMERFSAWMAVLLYVMALMCAAGYAEFVYKKTFPKKMAINMRENGQFKIWLSQALPLLVVGGSQVINSQADLIMVGSIKGASAAGIYAAVVRGARFVLFGLVAVNSAMGPIISQLYTSKQLELMERKIAQAAMFSALVCGVPLLFLFFFGRHFLALFGPGFAEGYSALICLGTAFFLCTLAACVGMLLMMTDFQKDICWISIFSALLNISLNALLIPSYSYNGAAAATGLSTLILNLLIGIQVVRRLKINPTVFAMLGKGQSREGK